MAASSTDPTRDELEIRNVLARLAHLADEGGLDDYLALFTDDAVWGGAGFSEVRGHTALREAAESRRAEGVAGPGTDTRHVVGTTFVELAGDEASAQSVFHFYGNLNGVPELRMIGVYRDRFRRTESGWKLARRDIQGPGAPDPAE